LAHSPIFAAGLLVQALELKEGAAIADALLEEVLSSEDRGTSSTTTGPFTFLLALHAFATADARLVSPQSDPVKFLRHLSPYLKVCPFTSTSVG
jgi:hypothetical protein